MTYMLLEHGVGQFTLMSTRFFDTYQDAVEYWATQMYKFALVASDRVVGSATPSKNQLMERYSKWGDLYEAKAGNHPKRIKEFHFDVFAAMTRKNV